jgi:hypothetical protein
MATLREALNVGMQLLQAGHLEQADGVFQQILSTISEVDPMVWTKKERSFAIPRPAVMTGHFRCLPC